MSLAERVTRMERRSFAEGVTRMERRASAAEAKAREGVLLFSLRWQRKRFFRPGCQKRRMAEAHSSLLRWPLPWQIRIFRSWG